MEPITFFIGKFLVTRAIRKSIIGTAASLDVKNGIRGLDMVGDQDGKIEIQDAVDFGDHELDGVSDIFHTIVDFFS